MTNREYRILIAKDVAGIAALAGDEWTFLGTIRALHKLDTDDDLSFGDIGGVTVIGRGFVALA